MKIVHIITRLILGGAQENTLITCRELSKRGHDVTLITGPALGPEGELFEQAKEEAYDIIVIDKMRRAINPFYDAVCYYQLKKILKKIGPDIIHTHSAKAGILGRFAGYSLKTEAKNRPHVVHTIHGLAFHPYLNKALNKFYIAVEKSAEKRTDAFVCVADAMTTKAVAAGIGRPEDFTTAYSAIDEKDFLVKPSEEQIADFRRKYGIGQQATVLVAIARLAELKGHEFIIESAKRLAPDHENCIWLFVGDGNLARQIKSKVQVASLGYKIKFTGLLPPGQIPLAIHSSDILVHCSLREGLARVLPQAMLCGKPVVSFDIDGAREVVNKNTGFLVEPENIDEFTKACMQLILDPELSKKLGRNGQNSVIKKFAPETMVDTIENLYNKLYQ
ncbi:MAG: glycosyltransferase family 4 protein [Sedimentisphaerales bacterium]|nr:glycosyltransferase family 4 protein [Sedimentisphaerales bacterium]